MSRRALCIAALCVAVSACGQRFDKDGLERNVDIERDPGNSCRFFVSHLYDRETPKRFAAIIENCIPEGKQPSPTAEAGK